MSKTIGKVCVVSLLIVALAVSFAFATTSRQNSLARSGDYINDDSNIFRWYGTLPSYSDLVLAEVGTHERFGDAEHQALGVTYSCGEEARFGTWGVFLFNSLDEYGFYVAHSLVTPWLVGFLEAPRNKFAIQWGYEFEKLAVGLGFTRSDESSKDETVDPVDEDKMSFTTVGAGIRADVSEKAYADVAFTVGFAGYESQSAVDTIEIDKKLSFDIAARMFYEWKDYATVVPLVDFQFFEFALKDMLAPHGDKGNAFRVGAALNIDVNTDNLLIFALEFQHIKWEYSIPDTTSDELGEWSVTYLPTIRLALESDVKPWLTARLGASKHLEKYVEKNNGGQEYTGVDSYFNWFLGVGFHIAEFDIDAELGPEMPFSIGYWLTGYTAYPSGYGWGVEQANGDYNTPIGRISAVYHF